MIDTVNKKELSERDICTKYITPAIERAGWDVMTRVREEVRLTDGQILVRGKHVKRGELKRADYVLFHKSNLPLAIIEAKDNNKPLGGGVQQALEYGEMLDVPFVFSSNGDGFLFRDNTGQSDVLEQELSLEQFPSPTDLWQRYKVWKGITNPVEEVTQTAQGRTALTAAAAGDHVAVARLLIESGADPDPQDSHHNNALLLTGETGSVAMPREVLQAKPVLSRTNRFGGTPLIPAADRGHVAYVREVLKTDLNVNHVNNLGWTALLEAVILGDGGAAHTEIVQLLIDAGADVAIVDREGATPLEHARQRGYREMIELLEAVGGY